MAINKLNRQNWNNITIHKIKLEDAQNRIDSYRRTPTRSIFGLETPLQTGLHGPKATLGRRSGVCRSLVQNKESY